MKIPKTTEIVLGGEFVMCFRHKGVDIDVWKYKSHYYCFDNSNPDQKEADIYELDYKDIVMFHAFFSNKQIRFGNF